MGVEIRRSEDGLWGLKLGAGGANVKKGGHRCCFTASCWQEVVKKGRNIWWNGKIVIPLCLFSPPGRGCEGEI